MGIITKLLKTGFIIAVLIFSPGFPPYDKFNSYEIKTQPLIGPLTINKVLEKAEKLFVNEIIGPETITDSNGVLYTGLLNGSVVKLTPDGKLHEVISFGNENCNGYFIEPGCGRPLGLDFDKEGRLYVMEPYSGIWRIDENKTELLVSVEDKIDGKPIRTPNSISIASNGDFYWTDSSSDYQLHDVLLALLADGTGRLFKYSAQTKSNEVLIDNLHFANGVQLSENEDFVLVIDLMKTRILRYYLKGAERGTWDVFIDGLPGVPDNLSPNKRCGFLVPLVHGHDEDHPNLVFVVTPFWWIRKAASRVLRIIDYGYTLAYSVYPMKIFQTAIHYAGNYRPVTALEVNRATVVELGSDGRILGSYHSLNDSHVGYFSAASIVGEFMYFGSPYTPYLSRIKLTELGINPSEIRPKWSNLLNNTEI